MTQRMVAYELCLKVVTAVVVRHLTGEQRTVVVSKGRNLKLICIAACFFVESPRLCKPKQEGKTGKFGTSRCISLTLEALRFE